jgi:hypothetical protein
MLALALAAGGCLKNEETIEVRPDGSLRVVVRASGDRMDLAGGFPLPLGQAVLAGNAQTQTWIERLGPDTGGDEVLARAAALDWGAAFGLGERDGLELAAEAHFPSVADWPRFAAPEGTPFQSAYSDRSAALVIEQRGAQTVYTFERVYHGRAWVGFDLAERMNAALVGELGEKLDAFQPLDAAELATLTDVVRAEHVRLAGNLARAATDLVYSGGSAALAPEAAEDARAAGERAVAEILTVEYVAELWDALRAFEALPEDERLRMQSPAVELDSRLRDALRGALGVALRESGTDTAVVGETLTALEWAFARFDHTLDLSDEEFAVELALPGVIVSGNYDKLENGRAAWEFSFEDLRDRDVVLRAVSVLPR